MEKRIAIAWSLLAGVVLLAGWWGLVPKIGKATEAEVRAHVAPELLQPLPHPEGGVARFEAMQRALDKVPNPPWRPRDPPPPLDLADPAVSEVIGILREGPLDRTRDIPLVPTYPATQEEWAAYARDSSRYGEFMRFARGLRSAASRAADQGDWAAVRRHIDASGLLLQRLFESDARLQDRRWTMSVETEDFRAALALAARRNLPADLAARLAELVSVDRHDPASLMQVLRGEMQYVVLPRIGMRPLSYYQAGTYDPIETTELLSTRLLKTLRDAGSPGARQSADSLSRVRALNQLTTSFWLIDTEQGTRRHSRSYLAWPVQRIRLNTARNSIGRVDVETYADAELPDRMRRARSLQDQVAAALAVVRFRQRAGRDPRSFGELVAAGLLRAVPRDHLRNEPLPFDLKGLFEWRETRRI